MALHVHSHLQGISAFVHSVEGGSFTAAAARMGVSKSATAKSVARLEDRLGVRLLARTTRQLSLTTEGETYYRSCLKVLDELNGAEALLAARQRSISGLLRVNLPVSFGRLCIMPVLQEVAAANPDLELDVSFTDRLVDLVEEGVDLAIRLGHPGHHASVIGRRIGTQRSLICASPAYLDEHGRPQSALDLAGHACLAFGKDGRPLPWRICDSDRDMQEILIKPSYTISHGEALRDATVAGLGLAYLSTWLAEADLRSHRLEVVPIATPAEDGPISAIWPRSRDLAPKVRIMVDTLVGRFMPTAPWDHGLS
ncbi:LysR family transcriptional regulator [Sphingomonas sp. QA11]|uniref:LysR family transcriptional regulator n=1 Tax=Sphingomonas sp. QA11 TaxID=2950605 RepID=UPI00234954BB|nr:LysR family transcriptional regulator [Sphingomonas sp. QA11]WCM25988.1 LysR family transcriptional regulator [Sphingomonas sp. QA11]